MTSKQSILKSGSYSAVGTIVYAISQFVILISFAKLSNFEVLGQYALSLAITAPVFMFANLRLRFVVATDVAGEFEFRQYAFVRAVSSWLAIALLAAGVAVFLGRADLFWLMLTMSLVRAVESYSDLVYGLFQRLHRFELMAISMCLSGIGMSAGVVFALLSGFSVVGVVATMLIVRVGVFLFFDVLWLRRLTQSTTESSITGWLNSAGAIRIAMRCFPLGVVALLVALNTNVPRYFVEFLLGTESLGVFAALVYIPVAGYLVIGTVAQSFMPRLAESYSRKDFAGMRAYIAQLYGLAAVAGAGAVLFAWLLGEHFLALVYEPVFSQYAELLVWLLIGGAISFLVVVGIYILTATGRYRSQMIVYAADLLLVSIFCALLVPKLALNGAAFAILASQLVQLAIVSTLVVIAVKGTGTKAPVSEN